VARIQALRAQDPRIKFADFAILYRANHQARMFEQKLRMAQIPYKVSGGRASSTRPRSRTCAPGCACWSTRTTTRPSCAR
jgi:superfamily I DNA/RNA helicase